MANEQEDVIGEEDEGIFDEPKEGEEGEQTPQEKNEDDGEKDDDKSKSRRSAIAQKKHWRGKYREETTKRQELEAELEQLKKGIKPPSDDKERAAQEYIRQQARDVYKELQLQKAKEESDELKAFESKIEEILEDNPDVAEEELLDIIEEFEVEPRIALKIFKKQSSESKTKKPRMPKSRQASPESDDKDNKKDDSKKSIYQIAQEEISKLKS